VNYKRKSRRRFFLLVRSRTPPIFFGISGGVWTPQTPPSVRHWPVLYASFSAPLKVKTLVILWSVLLWTWPVFIVLKSPLSYCRFSPWRFMTILARASVFCLHMHWNHLDHRHVTRTLWSGSFIAKTFPFLISPHLMLVSLFQVRTVDKFLLSMTWYRTLDTKFIPEFR